MGLCHKCLSKSCFLRRTSEQLHGSLKTCFLQVFFDDDRGSHRPGPQCAVTAAMTILLPFHRTPLRTSGLLAEIGKRIVLCQDSDHRAAASVGADQSRLDSRRMLLHLKAFRFQYLLYLGCAPVFLISPFRIFPNRTVETGNHLFLLFQDTLNLFLSVHTNILLMLCVFYVIMPNIQLEV